MHSLRESFVQVSCSKEENPTGADGREEESLAQARDPGEPLVTLLHATSLNQVSGGQLKK